MSQAKSLVDEQVKALSAICDLEAEVTAAFHAALLPIAERYLASSSASGSLTSDGKIKIGKKTGGKRVSKPKEEKLSTKNSYHFFVADKMAEVKQQGIEAKLRMKKIGEMWKALSDEQRLPYKEMADRYNAFVAKEMQTDDWKSRKESIMAAANSSAKSGSDEPVPDLSVDVPEEDEATADVADETESVSTTVSTVSAPAPTPVKTAPTQPQDKAPVRKKGRAAK